MSQPLVLLNSPVHPKISLSGIFLLKHYFGKRNYLGLGPTHPNPLCGKLVGKSCQFLPDPGNMSRVSFFCNLFLKIQFIHTHGQAVLSVSFTYFGVQRSQLIAKIQLSMAGPPPIISCHPGSSIKIFTPNFFSPKILSNELWVKQGMTECWQVF